MRQRTMIEVFITNVRSEIQAIETEKILSICFPDLKINFDLEASELPYPCGHSILRVEGSTVEPACIISTVNKAGFSCDLLEDKVCK